MHTVWDAIIILVLHNNRHAIKIAFIYWILSVGQGSGKCLPNTRSQQHYEVALRVPTLQMRKMSLREVKQFVRVTRQG